MKTFKKHLGWFVLGALVMVCLGFTIVEGLRVRTPGSVGQPGIGKVLMATTSEGDVAWTNQIVLAAATGISLHPNGQTITISNSASAGGAGSTNFQGARILKTTSSQSIPANTATLVTFNTVVYDTDSMTASANQLTMPRDGYYRITAQLYWNGSGSGTSNFLRMLYIRIGGSVGKDIGAEVNYQVDNELCMQNASAVIYMLQSDPVTIMATHSRSAAEFLLTDPTLDGCFLEAVYLGSDVAAGGTVTPAGDSGAIQFNEGDAFAGTNDFTFDRTNRVAQLKGTLSVTEAVNAQSVIITNIRQQPFVTSPANLHFNGTNQYQRTNAITGTKAIVPTNLTADVDYVLEVDSTGSTAADLVVTWNGLTDPGPALTNGLTTYLIQKRGTTTNVTRMPPFPWTIGSDGQIRKIGIGGTAFAGDQSPSITVHGTNSGGAPVRFVVTSSNGMLRFDGGNTTLANSGTLTTNGALSLVTSVAVASGATTLSANQLSSTTLMQITTPRVTFSGGTAAFPGLGRTNGNLALFGGDGLFTGGNTNNFWLMGGGLIQDFTIAAPAAPDRQGAVYWNDGTNVCVVLRNAAGALSTNKLSMTAWP